MRELGEGVGGENLVGWDVLYEKRIYFQLKKYIHTQI